jgi:hypothetical protein
MEIKHGTHTKYKHGCRCEICSKFMSGYMKKRNGVKLKATWSVDG